ncbi:glycosyltransferase 8 domain-containing protein 1-like [Neopsephotus bourkii]|uniref:glycosyltransferase 8 domain-containing protein 1-like n=1 Tax=Neopsephotus bourkii TaxID=309878 RepID=UPI002AA58981|nr:glycosyltransferase 8 domain-containing protein 1-like [Neopsephotus bourkii]
MTTAFILLKNKQEGGGNGPQELKKVTQKVKTVAGKDVSKQHFRKHLLMTLAGEQGIIPLTFKNIILYNYNIPLKPGHAAAFSDDCDSITNKVAVHGAVNQYNYTGFLDYKKETIRKLAMKANTCSFNPGVIVANLTECKLQNITKQLEKWIALNIVKQLYSRTLAGSITTPPLLIVLYTQHSCIVPMWNVQHLGSTAGKRYTPQFVKTAKLLHWNGHFKPWGRTASYAEVWEKWYVPDPTGKFDLIRTHSEACEAK